MNLSALQVSICFASGLGGMKTTVSKRDGLRCPADMFKSHRRQTKINFYGHLRLGTCQLSHQHHLPSFTGLSAGHGFEHQRANLS